MAKKFVRGVTGVEDIESFDKTLTNVNDLISDGQNTYVHTKKGKVESYYNLTESLKAVSSDDSDLITVTKDESTNNATLHPKHDTQKEQTLESTRNTVTLQKGANGTSATTKVDTNPQKVLEHDNLIAGNYITKTSSGDKTSLKVSDDFVGVVNGKQNTIINNASIGYIGTGLRQLYALKQTYSVTDGLLKTHVKSISENINLNRAEEEFNFIIKINKGVASVNFTLNTQDTTKFTNIMSAYGSNNTVRISGCVFTLSGSTLTVSTTNNTNQNYVITFSDII